MKKKILSFLLAASMLFTAQGIPTMAGSVADGSELESTETESPANPVHHCTREYDGSDNTDWSYVYFGSYPQIEVTGDALTAEITEANYDANGDAWVNGTKYRRASKSDANNTDNFGDSDYRYFKWERIKWRVLENNGSTLFVVADQGLDCKDYNETYTSVTWETCTLRTWLNGKFYNTAFSSSEQEAIVQQTVVNDRNPEYRTSGGNNTQDNVYLLSIAEVENPEYGFCEDYSVYSASRWMQPSDYAHAMGAYTSSGYEGNCRWNLRSPGNTTLYVTDVRYDGYVDRTGGYVNYYSGAVAPALQINLSSDLWYNFDDGTSGEGGSMGNKFLILSNPNDQKVIEGTSLTFNIAVSGGGNTYQWYYASSETGTGTKIDGETNPEYTIPSSDVNAALNGRYYYCVASNGISTATSDRAKLTVYFPPTVSISENQRVTIDDSVEFSVTASGGNPTDYTYQWYYTAAVINEGTPIKGATSANYKIPQGEVTANLDGLLFYCIVSNGQYTVRSDNAKLTIYEAVPGETPPGDSSGNTSGGTTSGGDIDKDDNNNNSSSGDSSTSGDNSSSGDSSTSGDSSSSGDSSNSGDSSSSSNSSNSGNSSSSGNNTSSSGNNTSSSGSGSGTAADTSVKLTAPKLTVKLSASNAVKLSWNKISGAAGYILYRSDSKTGKFTKKTVVTGTSYTDTKLKKGKTYYYKVMAYAGNTTGKESNIVSKKIIGKLTRPKLQKISIIPGGKFSISWKNIKNAQKIEIQISIDGGKYKKWKTVAAKKGKATYSYLSFQRNHKYSFKLRAYYKADGKKIYSKVSNAYAIIRN